MAAHLEALAPFLSKGSLLLSSPNLPRGIVLRAVQKKYVRQHDGTVSSVRISILLPMVVRAIVFGICSLWGPKASLR